MINLRALRISDVLFRNVRSSIHLSGQQNFSLSPRPPPIYETPKGPNKPPPNLPPKKFPELLYFPKIFRWLGIKLKLKYLRKAWDPEFHEGAFIYGSTQAICRISQIIHHNKPNELKGLLTDAAEKLLRAEMIGKLTSLQRKVMLLTPEDIKLLVPIKVQLIKHPESKQCLIMVKSLSMKWYHENQITKLVLIVIDTEFTRQYYSQGNKSEWFVNLFKIVQCAIINGSQAPKAT